VSDHLDGLFERLRETPPPEPFAPAAAVRRRGRQRSLRQAASVGVAVLALVGLGAASLVTIGRPAPPAPPVSVAAIPDSWLLTATDLGAGAWVADSRDVEALAGDPPWIWGDLCVASLAVEYRSLASRTDLRTITWSNGPWHGEADPTDWVYQVVELFDASAAVANLNDVRTAVSRCDQPILWSPQVEVPKYAIVDADFTGDESLLVEERAEGEIYAYTAVVRVGAAVTTLRSYDVELARADDEYLRQVADRAATRLG
jgi:uncharacterized OB-fold protein